MHFKFLNAFFFLLHSSKFGAYVGGVKYLFITKYKKLSDANYYKNISFRRKTLFNLVSMYLFTSRMIFV